MGTIFLDRSGRELRFLPDLKGERARWTPLQDVPEHVRNAFIAAEEGRPLLRNLAFDTVAPHLIDQLSRLGVEDGRAMTTIDRDVQIKVQEILLYANCARQFTESVGGQDAGPRRSKTVLRYAKDNISD